MLLSTNAMIALLIGMKTYNATQAKQTCRLYRLVLMLATRHWQKASVIQHVSHNNTKSRHNKLAGMKYKRH